MAKNAASGITVIIAVTAVFCLISCPAKALIYWTNSSGTADFFDWYNGGSDKGLFGSPTLVGGDSFLFTPSNFRAESINGIPSIKSDRLEFSLLAHEGYTITGIQITEYGDYGILDSGKVSASGTVFATNLNVFEVRSNNFQSIPPSPITTGTGDWSAQAAITGFNWNNLKIVLNNNLIAISSPGSTSFIEKKIMGGAVTISPIGSGPQIPEPATILLLVGGTALLLKKP